MKPLNPPLTVKECLHDLISGGFCHHCRGYWCWDCKRCFKTLYSGEGKQGCERHD